MGTFLSFVCLGLSLAIPVGAINIEMIRQGLRSGFWSSMLVSFGGFIVDFILIVLVYIGVTQFLLQPIPKTIIWGIGAISLVYLGYTSIRDEILITTSDNSPKKTPLECLVSGFVINIANPMSIVFWVGIYGSVVATFIDQVSFSKLLFYSNGLFLGVLLWDIALCSCIHFTRKVLTQSFIRRLSIFAGISLIGFGLYFSFKCYQSLLFLLT